MSSVRSSALAAIVTAACLAASVASSASAAEQKPTAAACQAARLSAWFEHQRQLDVDNNPFFAPPTPKECEMDGARRAENRDSTQPEVVASQAATSSEASKQVR